MPRANGGPKAAASPKPASAETNDGSWAGDGNGKRNCCCGHDRFQARDSQAGSAGWTGVHGKIADAFDESRPLRAPGPLECRGQPRRRAAKGLKQRMMFRVSPASWSDESRTSTADRRTLPANNRGHAHDGSVAKATGQSMALEVDGRPLEGEFLRSAKLVNKMIERSRCSRRRWRASPVRSEPKANSVDRRRFARCVRRVERLTEWVNQIAGNLTTQVRNIADVTIAVANGDLSKRSRRCRGEILGVARKRSTPSTISFARSLPKSLVWPARSVPRDSAVRQWCLGGRHLEGSPEAGECDGVEPHRPGSQHRRSNHGGRAR